MEAIEGLKTRHCVRVYTGQSVPREVIEDIIDCARLAPTARNEQPWEFVVVTDPTRLHSIAQKTDFGRFIATAPVCVAVFCKDSKYYLEDGSNATLSILLAAKAYGLGACWVAGDKKTYADDIRKEVGAPSGYKLISLVPIGYPAEQPHKPKRSLHEVLHWEMFRTR
jgi:nitroreductase